MTFPSHSPHHHGRKAQHLLPAALVAVLTVTGVSLTSSVALANNTPAPTVAPASSVTATAAEAVSVNPPTITAPQRPIKFNSLDAAKQGLAAPKDANYVMWPSTATYLHEALRTLGPNDILVLPEQTAPYLIDTRDGFRASGIVAVDGPNNERIPVRSTYSDNGKNANMWFAMARATRGIIGMGPGVKIALSESPWKQGQQKSPPDGVMNPTPEQHRKAYRADGTSIILYGAQESIIESDTAGAFFGNFTMTGRDLGGVAYTAIKMHKSGTVTQSHFIGAGRGFSGIPNGEAGAISFGRDNYLVVNTEIDGRDHITGKKVGSSPIMWNKATGGTVDNVYVHGHWVGMPSLWNSTGVHTWNDFSIADGDRMGVNLEKNYGDLTINWWGGKVWASPTGYHLNMNTMDGSSQKVNVKDVTLVGGRAGDGILVSHGYNYAGEIQGQKASDVKLTLGGKTVSAVRAETGLNRAYGTIR